MAVQNLESNTLEKAAVSLVGEYMSLFVEDAAQALAAGEKASQAQLSAWARIENGARGYCNDYLINQIARSLDRPSSFVWKSMRERAHRRAEELRSGRRQWKLAGRSSKGARLY